jgi:hypothetical protein
MISALIKENRELRRRVEMLGRLRAGATSDTVECALRPIVRRIRSALNTGTGTGRRRKARETKRATS